MGHCLWIHNLELAIRYFDDIDCTLIVIVLVDPRLVGSMHPPDAPGPAFSAFLALRSRKPLIFQPS